ncbi:hypothetical protein ACWKSP_28885 [Micromonosporaceae bacterium Da 78-11]
MIGKRWAALAATMLLPLAVAGCKDDHPVASTSSSKGTDSSAASACSVFAAQYRRADTTAARLRLADEAGRFAARSANGAVAGRAASVGRSADRGDDSWQTASADLLKACRRAGWKPGRQR